MEIDSAKARDQLSTSVWLMLTATALLLTPAIWNRCPLIFADSSAYLMVAWTADWPADRSGFYGLFLRPFSFLPSVIQVWLWTILQSAAVGAIILVAIRRMNPTLPGWATALMLLLLAIATPLPWHASQLMPDAFTGVCVLAVWLACNRDPRAPRTPLLWLAAYLSALTHYTHIVLLVATGAATLTFARLVNHTPGKDLVRRAIVCAVVALLVTSTQIVANGTYLKRWSVAPVGSAFLFARLHEDGLVQPWMARHCPLGETPLLCRVEPGLPHDSQKLLWNNNSAFLELTLRSEGAAGVQPFSKEVRSAAIGSIAAQPFNFAVVAVRATAEQFTSFRILDDECPAMCGSQKSTVYSWVREHKSSLFQALMNSRQVRGRMYKQFLRDVITPLSAAGLILLPLFLYLAWRRGDGPAFNLVATITVALLANAFVTGAFSDVHDRYQSRVVWLAPFALMLLLTRWRFSLSADRNSSSLSTTGGVPDRREASRMKGT